MTRILRAAVLLSACGVASVGVVRAQFGGRTEWTTSAFDAQRTGWLRNDAGLTRDAVQKGTFQFLWKVKFENEARQLNSLTQPVLQDLLIGYRGFKTLAFMGGSGDRVFAIDTDLARPYWTTQLNYAAATGGPPPSSWECPGGLIATPSRRTALAPSAFGGGAGGGRGGRATSAVGEPGRGAAVLSQAAARPGRRPADASPADAPPPPAATTRPPVAAIPFGGVDPLYVMGSDGLLRTLRVSDGGDMEPPAPFLPPSTRPSSLIFVDGMVYTSTSHGCGASPNAVWALDTTSKEKKVTTWKTGGASVAGSSGPTLGSTGALYVAVGSGSAAAADATTGQGGSARADAVVALDRYTLQPTDWFTAQGADFNTSPVVIRHNDKDLLAVAGNDGRLYLLDGASLGGPDHKTPLHVTAKYTAAGAGGALATWEQEGTRFVLAPVVGAPQSGGGFTAHGPAPRGSIVAFKLVQRDGKTALEPAWQSRDLLSPLAPIVVNDLVLAVSSGEYRGAARAATAKGAASITPSTTAPIDAAQRARRSLPAVLYVLDGATGKELWSSGRTITSFARAGTSAGGGQAYVVTHDSQLYAFGIPLEH